MDAGCGIRAERMVEKPVNTTVCIISTYIEAASLYAFIHNHNHNHHQYCAEDIASLR